MKTFLQQWDLLLNGDLSGVPSYFTNVTGSTNYLNFQFTQVPNSRLFEAVLFSIFFVTAWDLPELLWKIKIDSTSLRKKKLDQKFLCINRDNTTTHKFFLQAPDDFQYYSKYLALPEVRKAIHVGNLTFNDGDKVEQHLVGDILQSISTELADVMEHYKVRPRKHTGICRGSTCS